MRIASVLTVLAASFPATAPLPGQAVVLDEGTFIIEIAGRPVGTEEFRIRRSGFGENAQVIAQGNLELRSDQGTESIQSALGTLGVGMTLDAYQVKVTGPRTLQLLLQRRGDRLIAETTSASGVEERQYRRPSARTPTVLLDRFIAHHYFFLGPYQSPADVRVSVIHPRPGGQAEAVLRMGSVEPVTLGERTLRAQRLQLVIDGTVHEIWLDSQNRVLRVEIPRDSYVAVRREPPS